MKKQFLLLFVVSLTFGKVFSQQDPFNTDSEEYLTNTPITVPKDKDYRGSHYENETFEKGLIYKNDTPIAVNVGIRYNALRDEIEIKENLSLPETAARVLVKSPDIYVRSLNKIFVYEPQREGLENGGYLQLLFEGENLNLYKKITKEFVEGMESVNSMTTDVPDSFKENETYYLNHKTSNTFEALESSKRKRIEALGSSKKEIKSFLKDKDLNIKREDGLIKTVKFVDTL